MESSKLYAFLIMLLLSFSYTPLTLACGSCTPTPETPKSPITLPPIIGKPPITLPPVIGKPPITLPPVIGKPPITLPPIIGKPPITLPPVIGKPPITLPPVIGKPPITLPPIIRKPPITLPPVIGKPPVTLPPVTLPPIIGGGGGGSPGSSCPTPPAKDNCPIDALKLGACVDLLGNTIHLGDPAVQCCPLIEGLAGVSAAACLCTALKASVLDINVFLPIALKLLVTCGNAAPPGYTCA